MSLYVDCAYLEDVARVCAVWPITGATTNPSILVAALDRGQQLDDLSVLTGMLAMCSGPIFMQPTGAAEEDLYAAAIRYVEVAPERVILKLLLTPTGLRTGMRLKREGRRVAFTCVSTLEQAYCAATVGADWVIPYIGRLRRAGTDACERVAHMARLLACLGADTRILAASIKSGSDLVETTLAGAHDVTADPRVIESLLSDPLTDAAAHQFRLDWERFQAQRSSS